MALIPREFRSPRLNENEVTAVLCRILDKHEIPHYFVFDTELCEKRYQYDDLLWHNESVAGHRCKCHACEYAEKEELDEMTKEMPYFCADIKKTEAALADILAAIDSVQKSNLSWAMLWCAYFRVFFGPGREILKDINKRAELREMIQKVCAGMSGYEQEDCSLVEQDYMLWLDSTIFYTNTLCGHIDYHDEESFFDIFHGY